MRTDISGIRYNELRADAPGGFTNCTDGMSSEEHNACMARALNPDPALARKVFDTMPPEFYDFKDSVN